MSRSDHPEDPKTGLSLKLTCEGPDSALMAFTFTAPTDTTPQQMDVMRETSRRMADIILRNTPHKIRELEVVERKIYEEDHSDLTFTPLAKTGMSAELQKMVDDMYKTVDKHTCVPPAAPKDGEVAIPTGGLAKCECSSGCERVCPQPAYKILKVEKGDRWKLDEAQDDLELLIQKKMKKKK